MVFANVMNSDCDLCEVEKSPRPAFRLFASVSLYHPEMLADDVYRMPQRDSNAGHIESMPLAQFMMIDIGSSAHFSWFFKSRRKIRARALYYPPSITQYR
jgi:hypothetical protein